MKTTWGRCLIWIFTLGLSLNGGAAQAEPEKNAHVYVILWFDTEDYILPASDDAGLKVAELLTALDVKATFKVVGEKARTLEKRGRKDVIAALKKHEIGYHSQWHSVHPTPAMYLSNLGWDEGVAEFDRREGPGRADVERIFGVAPSCYGQPGSSWGPQSYGAMRKWGMPIYLDAGGHVNVEGKPCYYGGVFNLYKLEHTMRAGLAGLKELEPAQERFLNARKKLLEEGGGVVSIVYHPCEFVHKEFWDGANFRKGANPPREEWKLPAAKTAEESRVAFQVLENYVRFMKRFPEVQFITASEAGKLYRDRTPTTLFDNAQLKAIASAVAEDVTFQKHGNLTLSAGEVFVLLNSVLASYAQTQKLPAPVSCPNAPFGPTGTVSPLKEPVTTDWSQLQRTSVDVADYLRKQGRIPSAVWLGSQAVPPEAYLNAIAPVVLTLLEGKEPPRRIEVKPANLAAAHYVSADDPKLWGWVIFPPGFRAPAMMELARLQAWTVKPAVLSAE
jgi:hypothetical protein